MNLSDDNIYYMKTLKHGIIGLVFFISFSTISYSQNFWEWSDPQPLTDSVSDNSNPFFYYTSIGGGEALVMVWEKSTDSLSTSIFMDNILDTDTAEIILEMPGVHFMNPKIINPYYPGSDTSFFLLYESDINGNIDIFFKAFLSDGSFLEEVQLTTSASDESQLSVSNGPEWFDQSANVRNTIAYIRNDSLFVKHLMIEVPYLYFSEEILIDTPYCDNPVVSGNGITYLKKDTLEYHIFNSYLDWSGNWEPPIVYYDSADCRNISGKFYYEGNIWSAYIDTSWRILTKDYYGISTYTLEKETPFDPAAMGLVIGVKGVTFDEIWVATPFPEDEVDELYLTVWAGSSDFENFSNSGSDNRNPQFFHGESYPYNYYCWYDYLVWESYRNGHWQIWASKVIQCAGNIDEDEEKDAFISIYPNPSSNEARIEFTLDTRSDVVAEIYNSSGLLITSLANRSFNPGTHQFRWNGEDLTAGMYILKMTVGDRVYTSKLVKSR